MGNVQHNIGTNLYRESLLPLYIGLQMLELPSSEFYGWELLCKVSSFISLNLEN